MAALPSDQAGLLKKALELIEVCRVSAGRRAAFYRQLALVADTGRQDGTRAAINMMYRHLDRVASHLFSPTELRFNVDFDEAYPEDILQRGNRAGLLLTRNWMRSNADINFGQGVFEALKYGAVILKQWPSIGPGGKLVHNHGLVMPWQFGLYREDTNDISMHPALCETFMLSMPEVWRRIYHLPNADKLFKRIESHSRQGQSDTELNSFFHQLLSTGQLNTTGVASASRPLPGGIVQVSNMPNQASLSPDILAPMVKMHELWVWDEDDYTTIQVIEPDILIAPLFRKTNLLIGSPNIPPTGGPHEPEADKSQLHPYSLIQPNQVVNYFWGRSELTDLIEPQDALASLSDDSRRMVGLLVDKILGFEGDDGITDEAFDQMRRSGYYKSGQGASIKDLTPQYPAQLPELIKQQIDVIEMIGGLDGVMSGRGEPGVRAGNMQSNLMKTASPGLRDRSLLVERQCAEAADKWLSIMEAKDPTRYWTDGSTDDSRDKTSFFLSDLPEDRFVSVDSHSGSPIFSDDHTQLTAFGLKAGIIGPEDALDDLPFPNKEQKRAGMRKRAAEKQKLTEQLLQKDPQALEKLLGGHKGHR